MGRLFDDVTGPTAIPRPAAGVCALDRDGLAIRVGDTVERVAPTNHDQMREGSRHVVRHITSDESIVVHGVAGPWWAGYFRRVGGSNG